MGGNQCGGLSKIFRYLRDAFDCRDVPPDAHFGSAKRFEPKDLPGILSEQKPPLDERCQRVFRLFFAKLRSAGTFRRD